MEKMVAQPILSEKGHKLLVLDGYKFSKANISKVGKIGWKCCNQKCPARIYSNISNECEVVEPISVNHNHEESLTIARQALSNSIKRKAIDLFYISYIILGTKIIK